jgi:hypothetical protein
MGNNSAFKGYVVLVVGGAALVIASLILAGIATVPPLTTFLTDVALGLAIRASYKQIGGWDWNEWKWSFAGDSAQAVASVLPVVRAEAEIAEAA